MGNSHSSEQPQKEKEARRAPQKLSKPRVGNLTASNTTLTLKTSSSTARFSTSHLFVPPPPSSAHSAESINIPATPGLAISTEDVRLAGDGCATSEVSQQNRTFNTSTFQVHEQQTPMTRRRSIGVVPPQAKETIRRSASFAHHHDLAPLTPVCGSLARVSQNDNNNELAIPENLTTASSSSTPTQGHSPVLTKHESLAGPQLARRDSHQQTLDSLMGRSQSDLSLYAPTRRRSVIMTPGVATRPEEVPPPVSKRPLFRKSIPPTLDETRRSSSESSIRRHLSMPSQSSLTNSVEMVVTPSENDYKQIGAMKFGSLRIMNGSPVATPASECNLKPILPEPEELGAKEHTLSPDGIEHPRPLSAATNATTAVFSDASSNGAASSSDCTPFSQPSGVWKSDEVTPSTPATEPSTNPTPALDDMEKLSTDRSTSNGSSGDISRSNSGIRSSSSSDAKEPLSKADSGYSSSLSIKSLFGSKKSSKQAKEKSSTRDSAVPGSPEKRPGLKQSVPYSPNSKSQERFAVVDKAASEPAAGATDLLAPDDKQMLSRRTSLLGSFKSRMAREPKMGQSGHSRGKSVPDLPSLDASETKPTSSSGLSSSSPKPKKLHKLITSARRRSLPSMFPGQQPQQPSQEEVPSLPDNAAEKVQEQNRIFDEAQQGSFQIKVKQEQEPRDVDNDEADEVLMMVGRRAPRRSNSERPPRPRSTGPIQSGINRPPIPTNKSPSRRRSILRQPKALVDYGRDDALNYDPLSDDIMADEAQLASIDSIRRSAGNSAFDAAFAPLAEDMARGPIRRYAPPPPLPIHRTPSGSVLYPRLRSRRSAPDFLETVSEPASPGSVDCYSQKKPKTPPPISIRTRGSKKKKRRGSLHAAPYGGRPPQHPPMPMPYGQSDMYGTALQEPDLRQSLRSIPIARGPGDLVPNYTSGSPSRPMPGPGPNRRISGRPVYPPAMARPASHLGPYPGPPPPQSPGLRNHQRYGSHDEGNQPYRVLHSYQSPAYKGVPIWG